MRNFESLRPVAVLVSSVGLQVRDAGLNPVLIHFHRSCACSDPLTIIKSVLHYRISMVNFGSFLNKSNPGIFMDLERTYNFHVTYISYQNNNDNLKPTMKAFIV